MIWLLAVIGIAWVFLFIHNVRAFFRLTWMTAHSESLVAYPSVSMVVAARNEADIIERTLSSLLHLDYPDFEVILVDDQSSDGTGEIAAKLAEGDGRLSVIRGTHPPAGWVGKSWALHQGVAHATCEWLLFTDADCLHHPASLRVAMGFALDQQKELVSLIPALLWVSFAEKLVRPAFITFLGTFFPLSTLNRHPKRALAAGAFILIKRSAYLAVGGHAAIRASMLDDVSLARAVKRKGFSVWTGCTRELVQTRPYASFSRVWEGLGKHGFAFMGRAPIKAAVFALLGLMMVGVPLAGVVMGSLGQSVLTVGLAVVSMSVMVLLGMGSARMLNISPWWALFLPIGLLLYVLIVLHSMVQAWRGKLVWSGRQYGR
jgi:hopene-associated glycosyltransferase HpnB